MLFYYDINYTLCECKTCFSYVREENALHQFENKVFKKMCRSKEDGVSGQLRMVHNEESGGVCRSVWLRWLVAGLSPRRPGFSPRSIQWDLWWAKWHWDRVFSECFGFPLSISFHRGLHFSENKKKMFIYSFTPSLTLIRGRTKGP
jgi:hypothetical protein